MADWSSLMGGLNTAVLTAFGEEVTYLPRAGGTFLVRAIFEATRRNEESVPGTFASLFLRLANLPVAPQRGDEVRIGQSSYTVFEIQMDGQGGVIVTLQVR